MPLETLEIRIGSKKIDRFLEYEADSDLLVPADAFRCRLGKLTPDEASVIKAGQVFSLFVNGVQEMEGVIDRTEKSISKGELSVSIEGRDYGGILVDGCVEEWTTLQQMTLPAMAKKLLKPLPFVDKQKVTIGKGVSGTVKRAQHEPGVTVFQALAEKAQQMGLLFWTEPDGTLVFDRLAVSGNPAYSFYLYADGKNAGKNNVLSMSETDDISQRFSKCTVVGQIQGEDIWNPGTHSIKGTATDKTFPFYKPLVLSYKVEGGQSIKKQAEHELKKRVAEGYRLTVECKGHSQSGRNYRANRKAYVENEPLGIKGEFLVLARKFTMDKKSGPRTTLTLGKPMEGYSVA
jgi:prophage tail gpP-like protein